MGKTCFGDDLVILSSSGPANVLLFKSKASRLLDLIDDQKDDDIDTAVSIVAKKIVKKVKSIETDISSYDIRLTEENYMSLVSHARMMKCFSLRNLLQRLLEKYSFAWSIRNIAFYGANSSR